MNEPPDHTAVFSAANLLSSGGMTVPKYSLTRSGCSRRAVSVSQKMTPCFSRSSRMRVVDDLGLVLRASRRPGTSLGLGDAQPVERVLDVRSGTSSQVAPCFSDGRMK